MEEKYNDGSVRPDFMQCRVCVNNPLIADKRSAFFIGSTNFRIDPIKKHNLSRQRIACVRAEEMRAGPVNVEITKIGAGLLSLHSKERQRYQYLFRTAYTVAKKCKPFLDYEYICEVQQANDVDLGKNYLRNKSAALFTKNIADDLRCKTADNLKQCHYLSVICDGSTDLTVVEQEVVMVRYIDLTTCRPVTRLAALIELEHPHADGVYTALKDGLRRVISEQPEDTLRLCTHGANIVCRNFDGAAVMMGARNGVKAKLVRDYPCAVVIHCVAHKLELGILDAVKAVPYLAEFEASIKEIFKMYWYSPKRQRELKQVASTLDEELKSFSDIKQVRWVASKERALKAILQNLSSLAAHQEHMVVGAGNSSEEKSRARGILDTILSLRFIFWIHMMLDFLAIVTKVSRKFQQNDIVLLKCQSLLMIALMLYQTFYSNVEIIVRSSMLCSMHMRTHLVNCNLVLGDQPEVASMLTLLPLST